MKVLIGAGGRVFHSRPQQDWNGNGIMQQALFAGHLMVAVLDDDDLGVYRLIYLDYESALFDSMGSAKLAAPEFAKAVLQRMLSLVVDNS